MRLRFVADGESVVLIREQASVPSSGPESRTDIAQAAPIQLFADRSRTTNPDELDFWGPSAILSAEDFARVTARCLNAALSVDGTDIATASQALELLVSQQLAKLDAEDPVAVMEEAMAYILRQERWKFDLARERREDGTRILIRNPNGDPVPYAVHVSNRGRTPSFWVMQENRLVQGSHAYKIPIQAAATLKHAIEDFLNTSDIGTIRPFG